MYPPFHQAFWLSGSWGIVEGAINAALSRVTLSNILYRSFADLYLSCNIGIRFSPGTFEKGSCSLYDANILRAFSRDDI